MTTWRKELGKIGIKVREIEAQSPEDIDWDREFDSGPGEPEGESFLAWTSTHVVFPVSHDGIEWLEKLPRNPGKAKKRHIGRW